MQTHTIVYGHACNEGPGGDLQHSDTFLSRPETPSEQAQTARYAMAAFGKLGIAPTSCDVYFYGETGIVRLKGGRRVVIGPDDLLN